MRDDLQPLVFMAVDHAMESLRATGRTLTPFLLSAADDGVSMTRFAAETAEEGVAHGRDAARNLTGKVAAVALVYDGYVTTEGSRVDAVLVSVQAVGTATSEVCAQRYRIDDGQPQELGNVQVIARDEPPLLG